MGLYQYQFQLGKNEVTTTASHDNNLQEQCDSINFSVFKTCSIQHIYEKTQFVVHWSNSKAFTRIKKEGAFSELIPSVIALHKQKTCLSLVKITLQIVRCLKTTETKLESLLLTLLKSGLKDEKETRLNVENANRTLHAISSRNRDTMDAFQSAYKRLFKLDYFDKVVVYLEKLITPQMLTFSCKRIVKYSLRIISMLIEYRVRVYTMDSSCATGISMCSTLCSDMQEFICKVSSLLGNDEIFTVQHSLNSLQQFCRLNNSPTLHHGNVNSDVCCYLREVAEQKSYLLSAQLSMATLNSIQIYLRETHSDGQEEDLLFRNNQSIPPHKTKAVVRILKHIYRKILEDENDFFSDLVKEIVSVNAEKLKKNTNVLYNKVPLSPINRGGDVPDNVRKMTKTVRWDSHIGPGHQDYLFSVYMESLWVHIKKNVVASYVSSLYTDSTCACRLANASLGRTEQELLWQIHLKLGKNGSSPQTFLETLAVLAVGKKTFWCQQSFYKGLSAAMGVLVKDRFRYVESNIGLPSSPTIKELLQCHSYLQEHLTWTRRYKVLNVQDQPVPHQWTMFTLTNRFETFYQYLEWLLLYKRHQFLVSLTWQQLFVVSTADSRFPLLSCQRTVACLREGSEEIYILDGHLNFLEMFEKDSLKLMVRQLGQRSRLAWKDHMVNKKIWKRRGPKSQVHQASSYINVVMQLIFGPLLENIEILSRDQKLTLLCKCIVVFIKSWMDHILEQQIVFSRYGAQQLNFDFTHFVSWFENEELGFSLEEISEIHSLPLLVNMKNAIIVLACQPESQKNRRDEPNSLLSAGSSSSIISQVSLESYAGSQFEDVIKDIELHDKERWLALRAKGGQAKRFLCLT